MAVTPSHARPRLHRLYYFLAVFDVVTICLSLVLINRLTTIYADSVEVNARWAGRLSGFTDLGALAAEVNAPGNDVFDTMDIEREAARLGSAEARFRERLLGVRAELEANVARAVAAPMLAELSTVQTDMGQMEEEAHIIFDLLTAGDAGRAGERMARMDRHYATVTRRLSGLIGQVQTLQAEHFAEQTAASRALRRFEFVIAGLLVLIVVGVALYGSALARRIKSAAVERESYLLELERYRAQLEHLVDKRTTELEASHAQLRLAERMASLGTLAAGLGHDMNNVLFPVRCRLETLQSAPLGEAAHAEIGAMQQSIEYLQRLADGLRLLALDPDDPRHDDVTDLASWWDDVRPLFLTTLPQRATLEGDIDADLPAVVISSPRLTQAIFNLVGNAGEAIDAGGSVRVWARRTPDNGHVDIGVTDDGGGMTSEVKRRAMEPFFTTKTRRLSTGLGLALVHSMARAAQGTIDIETAPGEGTTVRLRLPSAPDTFGGPARARTVAVIDADRRLASMAMSVLGSAGILPATSPDDADVWVVDASDVLSADVEAFLAADEAHRVLAFGAAPMWSRRSGVVVIPTPPNLEQLRSVIKDLWVEDLA